MGYLRSFRHRTWMYELMDDPDSDVDRLHRTLRQFRIINRVLTRVHRPLVRLVLDDMVEQRPYTLLDVGAGDGDIARRLVRTARRRGLDLRVTCIDADARVASWCRQACAGYPEIEVLHTTHNDLTQRFDYVFSNHVLHHLADKEAESFLASMDSITVRRVVISDLARSAPAHTAYSIVSLIAFHRSFARTDGLRSIRRAFTRNELEDMLSRTRWGARAGVRAVFPAHLLIVGDFFSPVS
ncbi:MAG: methyltransferase domain-containing protein [Spirochaetaceae bacterium]